MRKSWWFSRFKTSELQLLSKQLTLHNPSTLIHQTLSKIPSKPHPGGHSYYLTANNISPKFLEFLKDVFSLGSNHFHGDFMFLPAKTETFELETTIRNIERVILFFKKEVTTKDAAFIAIYEKYRDTFVNLTNILIGFQEQEEYLSKEDYLNIVHIVDTFLTEFKSLNDLFEVKQGVKVHSTSESLRNALAFELQLVDKFRESWNKK